MIDWSLVKWYDFYKVRQYVNLSPSKVKPKSDSEHRMQEDPSVQEQPLCLRESEKNWGEKII